MSAITMVTSSLISVKAEAWGGEKKKKSKEVVVDSLIVRLPWQFHSDTVLYFLHLTLIDQTLK